MKSKAFIQIIGISATAVMVLGAASAFAGDSVANSNTADLRPVWMSDQSVYSDSSAFLYSDQDPSFLPQSLRQQIQANHSVQAVEDQYIARARDYQMRQDYGIASQTDEGSYVADVSAMGRSMFAAARLAPLRAYQQNFANAEKDGQVSKPVAAVGGVVAMGSGTPILFDLGNGARAVWSGDLLNEHGELNLFSPIMNAHLEMNMKIAAQDPTQPLDPNAAAERYKVSVNREIAFDVSSSIIYGSTSNSFVASLSRPLAPHLSGNVSTTRPAGDNPSGSPSEVAGGISYGMTF